MRQMQLKLFTIAVVFFSAAGFAACSTDSTDLDKEENKRQLSELERMLDAKFPEASKIVSRICENRNNEAACSYIIFSPTSVKFSVTPRSKRRAETVVKIMNNSIRMPKSMGELKEEKMDCYGGDFDNGQWRAYQTYFEGGCYLLVEQIFN